MVTFIDVNLKTFGRKLAITIHTNVGEVERDTPLSGCLRIGVKALPVERTEREAIMHLPLSCSIIINASIDLLPLCINTSYQRKILTVPEENLV